jgi:hypothetical protein
VPFSMPLGLTLGRPFTPLSVATSARAFAPHTNKAAKGVKLLPLREGARAVRTSPSCKLFS